MTLLLVLAFTVAFTVGAILGAAAGVVLMACFVVAGSEVAR